MMNETIRDAMRRELMDSRKGFGVVVGLICFFLLIFIATLIPGVDALMKNHTWPGWTILILSAGAGWIAGAARAITVRDEIERMDDDTLKFRHDKMSRLKQKSSIVLYLGLALVAAYWVFLR